jgi:hypothetical protein
MVKTLKRGESQDLMTTSQVDQLMAPASYDETNEEMFNLLAKTWATMKVRSNKNRNES